MSQRIRTHHVHVHSADMHIPQEVSRRERLHQSRRAIVSPNPRLPRRMRPLRVGQQRVRYHRQHDCLLDLRRDARVPIDARALVEGIVRLGPEAARKRGRDDPEDGFVEGEGEDDFVHVERKRREAEIVRNRFEDASYRRRSDEGIAHC